MGKDAYEGQRDVPPGSHGPRVGAAGAEYNGLRAQGSQTQASLYDVQRPRAEDEPVVMTHAEQLVSLRCELQALRDQFEAFAGDTLNRVLTIGERTGA